MSTKKRNGKSLVLVLGAGASSEVNLPIGNTLKDQIAELLNIRFEDGYNQSHGDFKIVQAFRLLTQNLGFPGDINPLIKVSRQIGNAMSQAISIDNFIDSHRGNQSLALCGKLAIALSILNAEGQSTLAIDRRNAHNKLNFTAIKSTWFYAFFQLLTENCHKDDLAERVRQIGVISFNYDRCFEHYLYHALQNYYELTEREAASILTGLEIHHPYGKVGFLPWMRQNKSVDFGADASPQELIEIAKLLRTFTEGTDPAISDIELIRDTAMNADRLLFLGFAFHRLNLDLLFSNSTPATRTRRGREGIYGTAIGISDSDISLIKDELLTYTKVPLDRINLRTDKKCAGLFSEYWRSLSLI